MNQTPEIPNHGLLMLRGALLGALVGALVGFAIAWMAGMLDGWNWPFVVFQTSLVFALSLGWTAPLFSIPETEERDSSEGEPSDVVSREVP